LNLLVETAALAAGIALFSGLPLFFYSQVKRHSRFLFLVGTGAMFGLCFFDLLPDVLEIGGKSSFYIIGVVWLIYSLIHLFHLGHHESDHDHDCSDTHGNGGGHSHSFALFCGSLITHCFASGILLALSHGLSTQVANTVFLALVAHKGYEALMFSSILMKQQFSRLTQLVLLSIYSLSLPMGVALAYVLRDALSQDLAVMMSSVAVGTLLGCLIFDFMIPTIRQLRQRRIEILWIGLGLLLTQLVMKSL
jgi:zinc transporter ZupT